MSNFPNNIDDDVTLPPVNNNLTEIGSDAINALRDAVFNIEENIGLGAKGNLNSIAERIGRSIDGDGYLKTEAIDLSIYKITNDRVDDDAQISESKLNLDHSTNALYDMYQVLASDTYANKDWIGYQGAKAYAHSTGANPRHILEHIVASGSEIFKNRFYSNDDVEDPSPNGLNLRDNSNLFKLITDLNNDYIIHQKMDGYELSEVRSVITLAKDSYPSNFAHHSSGIYLDPSRFNIIPQSINSLQKFADYVDSGSMTLLGSRVQSLFTSGIPRTSRSSTLTQEGGISVIPETTAECYLGETDNPLNGYDVIRLKPTQSQLDDYFASKFSLVKPGDIATVTYTNNGAPQETLLPNQTGPVSIILSPYGEDVYALNQGTNSISKINISSKAVSVPIGTGNNPTSMAISVENKAVVTNRNSNSAYIIDMNTSQRLADLSLGSSSNPVHVAITPDGTKAVIANYGNSTATVLDLIANNIIIHIACGTKPRYVSITNDGLLAAVVNQDSNNVTFINLQTYQVVNTISSGQTPIIAKFTNNKSHLIVANKGTEDITFIRINLGMPSENTVRAICSGAPIDFAITSDSKKIYVVNSNSYIDVIDIESEKILSKINCDQDPRSIRISQDNKIAIIACNGASKVNVLNLIQNKIISKVKTSNSVTPDVVFATITPDGQYAISANYKGNSVTFVNLNDIGVTEAQFTVKERKVIYEDSGAQNYSIRIDGKNIINTLSGTVKINRPQFNVNKGGVLSVSAVNYQDNPSLIISQPRGAVAIGNGFNSSQLSENCYNLKLVLYKEGNRSDREDIVVDVTGNGGKTPGYTIDDIVAATNKAFRAKNSRFVAFAYNGNFGIMLADSYRNSAFSIVAGSLNTYSKKYQNSSSDYPKHIITYDSDGNSIADPLGLSVSGSNVASRDAGSLNSGDDYQLLHYQFPIKIFYPLKRNNFYIDGAGTEIDRFALDEGQYVDEYGDGYWLATIQNVDLSTFDFTYRVNKNLLSSGLDIGKTAVVQPINYPGISQNFGRFAIKSINYESEFTDITFANTITGIQPNSGLPSGSANEGDGYQYAIYFNSDSVSFNSTNIFENSTEGTFKFKKNFEIYLNKYGKSFSHERARMLLGSSTYTAQNDSKLYSSGHLDSVSIVSISPKLRGYSYNNGMSKICLSLTYDADTSNLSGYLSYRAGNGVRLNIGQISYGKNKEVVRFYDDTGVDYIDFNFNFNFDDNSFDNQYADIQIFPTLLLDDEILPIASCQLNTSAKEITNIVDLRQFGNVSEKDISTSLINYINAPHRLINSNGIINGFAAEIDVVNGKINIKNGGTALVNGRLVQSNAEILDIPKVNEINSNGSESDTVLWGVCINEKGQYQIIALTNEETETYSNERNIRLRLASSSNDNDIYLARSIQFRKLINDTKDLTPIYILKSTVSYGNGVFIYSGSEISDVRRFITNEPLNNNFTWSSPSGELTSYFKSFEAVKNWINYYGETSNVIKVRGSITIDDSSNDFSKFLNPVTFEGDGSYSSFEVDSNSFNVGQNITYKNIKFNFLQNCKISQSGEIGNCLFENVDFINSSGDNNTLIVIENLQTHNKFTNCNFLIIIKRITLVGSTEFNNVIFDSMKNPLADNNSDYLFLIRLGNDNKFINCKFNKIDIDGSTEDCYFVKPLGEKSNNNLFQDCIFDGYFNSSSFGIVLNDYNKIINCKFNVEAISQKELIKLGDSNVLEDVSFKSLTSESSNILNFGSNNRVKNFYSDGLNCKSNDGYAVIVDGYGNIFDNFSAKVIAAKESSILLKSSNNQIINSTLSLQSKRGIWFNFNPNANDRQESLLIDNNKVSYIYSGESIDSDDKVQASLGGLLYFNQSIKNVNIKNCIFKRETVTSSGAEEAACKYEGGDSSVTIDYFPPIISFYASGNQGKTFKSIKIDNCRFIGKSKNLSGDNKYYAAIAIISDISNDKNLEIDDIYIENNTSEFNNGLIIAGKNGESNIKALNNIIISKNHLSYISAYSSASFGGNILIDGNACSAILSLDNKASALVSGISTTSNMIISNNSCEFINVYVAGN